MRLQIKLRDKWFFECRCPRCSDPTEKGSHVSSLVCQAVPESQRELMATAPEKLRRCGGTMSLSDPFAAAEDKFWLCCKCGNRIDADDVLNLENE